MIYQYLNLRFADKAQADAALLVDGNPKYPNIDILGDLSTPERQVSGWHVNLATKETPAELLPYIITPPLYPKRVWALEETGGII